MAIVSRTTDSRDGGSTPSGLPPISCTSRSITKTSAFRLFQRLVGGSTLFLSTSAIGLECLFLHPQSAISASTSLHIGWKLPTTVAKTRDLTFQTRTFLLTSVLTAACDAIDQYISQIVKIEWLIFSPRTRDIATMAITKPGGKAWQPGERLATICQEVGVEDYEHPVALLALAFRWRNAIVHATDAKFQLDLTYRRVLQAGPEILEMKAGFNVHRALQNFDEKRPPSLKEVTTLLSCAQDLCGAIDNAALKKALPSEKAVEELLKLKLRAFFRTRGHVYEFWGTSRDGEWEEQELVKKGEDRGRRSSNHEKKWQSRWGNLLTTLEFVETDQCSQFPLNKSEFLRLSNLSASHFADELGLI